MNERVYLIWMLWPHWRVCYFCIGHTFHDFSKIVKLYINTGADTKRVRTLNIFILSFDKKPTIKVHMRAALKLSLILDVIE